MVYTIRVILLLAHVESFKLSYCVKNKKRNITKSVFVYVEKGTVGNPDYNSSLG